MKIWQEFSIFLYHTIQKMCNFYKKTLQSISHICFPKVKYKNLNSNDAFHYEVPAWSFYVVLSLDWNIFLTFWKFYRIDISGSSKHSMGFVAPPLPLSPRTEFLTFHPWCGTN